MDGDGDGAGGAIPENYLALLPPETRAKLEQNSNEVTGGETATGTPGKKSRRRSGAADDPLSSLTRKELAGWLAASGEEVKTRETRPILLVRCRSLFFSGGGEGESAALGTSASAPIDVEMTPEPAPEPQPVPVVDLQTAETNEQNAPSKSKKRRREEEDGAEGGTRTAVAGGGDAEAMSASAATKKQKPSPDDDVGTQCSLCGKEFPFAPASADTDPIARRRERSNVRAKVARHIFSTHLEPHVQSLSGLFSSLFFFDIYPPLLYVVVSSIPVYSQPGCSPPKVPGSATQMSWRGGSLRCWR
jgi:hypothetical protein